MEPQEQPQPLTKGGRDLVNRLVDALRAAEYYYAEAMPDDRLTVSRPLAEAALRDLRSQLATAITIAEQDLPSLLERAKRNKEAASLPERVAMQQSTIASLEARIAQLEAKAEPAPHALRIVRDDETRTG